MCRGNALWCHLAAKSLAISTNGSNRSESRSPLPTSTMVEMTKMTSPEYLIEMRDIAVIPH